MRYFNFDLLIEQASNGDSFVARVLESPTGQARSTFRSPFNPTELENLILKIGRSRRGNRSFDNIPTRAAKDLGGRLFGSVFANEVGACLQSSIYYAESREGGLRIRLRLDAPGLADLPWEYLYNASLNSFLALSAETSLVRYLELARPMRPPLLSPPLKVLALIASPTDYPQLAGEDEWKILNAALQPLSAAGQVHLERLEQPTLAALQARLRRGSYHVLHFIGHGGFDDRAQDGLLILENSHGRGDQVTSHRLAAILHNHPSLQLVVLNCCEGARLSVNEPFSGVAQSLIQQGVPAVIAMQFEISDDAAITFGRVFYESLADGLAVDAALVEARTGMYSTRDDVEFGAPVLYMRSPDGVLFNLARPRPVENTVEVPKSGGGDLPSPEPAPPVEAASLPAAESETKASSDPAPDPPKAAASFLAVSGVGDLSAPRPAENTVAVPQSGGGDLPSPETALPVEAAPPPATESKTNTPSYPAPVPSEAAAAYPVVSGFGDRKPRGADWKRVALLSLAALAVVTIGALIARQFIDSRSQLEQALAWYTGQAGSVDYTKARQLLESAAAKGDDLATMFKARCIYFGRMAYPKDESLGQRLASTVIAKVENRAKAGNVPAAFLWGEALFEGIAVHKDEKQAAIWLDKACVGSNMISCGVLGFMYENGKGVTKDLVKAVELYSTACNGKALRVCDRLGFMYENGQGVIKDSNKAVELYRTACNGKELLGCDYLGSVYEDGRGVTKDLGKAIELYRAACDGGELDGCYRLGSIYSGGKGVAVDAAKAQELYRRACEGGIEDACTALRQPKT